MSEAGARSFWQAPAPFGPEPGREEKLARFQIEISFNSIYPGRRCGLGDGMFFVATRTTRGSKNEKLINLIPAATYRTAKTAIINSGGSKTRFISQFETCSRIIPSIIPSIILGPPFPGNFPGDLSIHRPNECPFYDFTTDAICEMISFILCRITQRALVLVSLRKRIASSAISSIRARCLSAPSVFFDFAAEKNGATRALPGSLPQSIPRHSVAKFLFY